jgi:hypothetical protein
VPYLRYRAGKRCNLWRRRYMHLPRSWIYAIMNSFFSRHENVRGSSGDALSVYGKTKQRGRRKREEVKLFYFWNARAVRHLSFYIWVGHPVRLTGAWALCSHAHKLLLVAATVHLYHYARYLTCWHFKVPAKATKLPAEPF